MNCNLQRVTILSNQTATSPSNGMSRDGPGMDTWYVDHDKILWKLCWISLTFSWALIDKSNRLYRKSASLVNTWAWVDKPGFFSRQLLQCSTGSNIGTSHRLVGSSAGVGQTKRSYGPCLARRQYYSRATALSTVPTRYLTVVHRRLLWSTCYPMSRAVCGSRTAVKVAYCKHSLKTQPKLWLFYKLQFEIRKTPTKLWRCPIISPYYRQGLDTLVALLSTFRSPCFLLQTAEDGQKRWVSFGPDSWFQTFQSSSVYWKLYILSTSSQRTDSKVFEIQELLMITFPEDFSVIVMYWVFFRLCSDLECNMHLFTVLGSKGTIMLCFFLSFLRRHYRALPDMFLRMPN